MGFLSELFWGKPRRKRASIEDSSHIRIELEDLLNSTNYYYKTDLQNICEEYGINSKGVKKDLIKRIVSNPNIDVEELLKDLTNEQLKDICEISDEPKSGNKSDLISRILPHIDYQPITPSKSQDKKKIVKKKLKFEVAFSFAGEDRKYVKRVAKSLKDHGVRVYFDEFEKTNLWGKDLAIHFDEIFREQAKYCVIFTSKHYARKAWPQHELKSALAKSIYKKGEYILPVRMDDTIIPGLQPTISYLEAKHYSPEKLARMVYKKIRNK